MTQEAVRKFIASSLTRQSREEQALKERIVITISRDTGCEGTTLAENLVGLLNLSARQSKSKATWKYVSREILEQSAEKLNLHPDKVTWLLDVQDKNMLEEMLLGLSSQNYPSDLKIKNTLKSVIKSIAEQGNVVILGRGGVAIIGHTPKTLHVKLTAPLDWRVRQVQNQENLSAEKAKQWIEQSDHDREALKTFYMGRKITYGDYDLVFNMSTLSEEEIAKAIREVVISRVEGTK